MQAKLEEMGEKESKLIKLVLAIKRTGVDIEKIYNEEVLNDETDNSNMKTPVQIPKNPKIAEAFLEDADNSGTSDYLVFSYK